MTDGSSGHVPAWIWPPPSAKPKQPPPIGPFAHLEAEERAARAEECASLLRSALAAVVSIAEVSIDAATLVVDEARAYETSLAEALVREKGSVAAAANAEASQVIAEARATVAELRAQLLGDRAHDDRAPGLHRERADLPVEER